MAAPRSLWDLSSSTRDQTWATAVKTPSPNHWTAREFRERFLKTEWGRGVMGCVIISCTFFWLVGGEVIKSQHHQPSASNRSGVYVLVGSIQLTSSTWWGFPYLQNSSKDMAQNIIYSPWGGTKGAWLCLFVYLFIGVKLLYNVVLVSGVQWSESAICIIISPPSLTSLPLPPSHPSRSSQTTELSSLCYIAGSH